MGAALALPRFAAGQATHAGHGATAKTPADGTTPKGVVVKFDGLCAVVQMMNGDAIKTIDVGLVNHTVGAPTLNVRPHIPTLKLPADLVVDGSAQPDAVSATEAFWNLNGWVLDFEVTKGTAESALTANAAPSPNPDCPKDIEDWNTLAWLPFATDFAPTGAKLRGDWRDKKFTSALVQLRRGFVDRRELDITPGDVEGHQLFKRFGGEQERIASRFLKGFFHYELRDAEEVVIRMTRQPVMGQGSTSQGSTAQATRMVRFTATKRAEILNMPVGPRLGRDDPYRDVAVYYELLDNPGAINERGIPHGTTTCPSCKAGEECEKRTSGCSCCPPFRYTEP
jgi:hypothetical protein